MNIITDQDIRRQVAQAVEANGAELAEGIDVDAVVADIQDTYGLVDVDSIDTDRFWAIVANHDTTQADEITTSAWNANTRCWEIIARENAADVGTDLDNVDLSADDLGCEPGAVFRVALVRDDDGAEREIRAVEIPAT